MAGNTNLTPSSNTTVDGNISIDNLYPAIVQCFVIILSGYVAGRISLISSTQSKGIGLFVSNFCLPALLFKSMCILDFSVVNWLFLTSILISKSLVFFMVVLVTLVAKRPLNFGYAGLFGIFSTQSNDFALGYPIIQALYGTSHPEYLNYIYLIAPISVVFLNPIGFALLEIQKRRNQASKDATVGQSRKQNGDSEALLGNSDVSPKKPAISTLMVAIHVFKSVISNPIVFMTLIGIIGNFIFHHHLPSVLEGILTALGDAFSATALFYLGLSLVGKFSNAIGIGLVVPLLLIAAKALILPLVIWQIVGALEDVSDDEHMTSHVNTTMSLSMYGFLYGTFPTAPSVFLYASHYSIAQDTMATGMVAGTFLSAPMMFMSAKMMTVVVNSEMDYKTLLLETSFDTSIISVVCCIWVLAILLFSKRYKKMPHQFLVCLVLSHLMSCVGMIIYNGQDCGELSWKHYVQFSLILIGVFATRCWIAVISVTLYMLHCRSLCSVLRLRGLMYLFGFGFPVFCTGILFMLGSHHQHDEIDPSFHYGTDQSIMSVLVLGLCSLVNAVCLILKQRNTREHQTIKKTRESDDKEDSTHLHRQRTRKKVSASKRIKGQGHSVSTSIQADVEDMPAGLVNVSPHAGGSLRINNECERQQMENKQDCDTCTGNCYQGKDFEDIVPFPSERDGLLSSGSSSVSDVSTVQEGIEDNVCKYGTCNQDQRRACAGLIRSYRADTASIQTDEFGVKVTKKFTSVSKDPYQSGRFMILLICGEVSMLVGLFLCGWRSVDDYVKSGIYVEIEFLDGVFNYGQGFLLLAIFGFDTKFIFIPCIKKWRRLVYGVEVVRVPDHDDLDEETHHLCDQFLRYHKANCVKDIVGDKVFRLQDYKDVFTGQEMCDWLVEVGLVRDRSEAITYGQSLVNGQIVEHFAKEHHFHDMTYFYKFVDVQDDGSP